MVGAGRRKKVKRYNFGSSPSKCGYIRWKTPAREREPLPVTCSRSDTVTLKNQL